MPFRATCNIFILKDDSKIRKLVFYKDYYDVFIKNQRPRVQTKIFWTIILIENVEKVPSKYLKYIIGSDGVFEIRILTRNDIFRIFCFFNQQNELVLINHLFKEIVWSSTKKQYCRGKYSDLPTALRILRVMINIDGPLR